MKPDVSVRATDSALLEQMPLARHRRLVVEDLDGETLVYDQDSDRAHCLNRAAAAVWRASDGATAVPEIARLLGDQGVPADETVVWMALARLERAQLLEDPVRLPVSNRSLSRKEVLRVLGLTAGLGLVLPAVSSITAPLAAQTASCVPLAQCVDPPACDFGLPICENRTVCCKPRGAKKCKVVTC